MPRPQPLQPHGRRKCGCGRGILRIADRDRSEFGARVDGAHHVGTAESGDLLYECLPRAEALALRETPIPEVSRGATSDLGRRSRHDHLECLAGIGGVAEQAEQLLVVEALDARELLTEATGNARSGIHQPRCG